MVDAYIIGGELAFGSESTVGCLSSYVSRTIYFSGQINMSIEMYEYVLGTVKIRHKHKT